MRFCSALRRWAMGLKCPESESTMTVKIMCKSCGKSLPPSKTKFALTSGEYECSPCYWGFGKTREFVDVTSDCKDSDRQSILASQVTAKLQFCHEWELYHAV